MLCQAFHLTCIIVDWTCWLQCDSVMCGVINVSVVKHSVASYKLLIYSCCYIYCTIHTQQDINWIYINTLSFGEIFTSRYLALSLTEKWGAKDMQGFYLGEGGPGDSPAFPPWNCPTIIWFLSKIPEMWSQKPPKQSHKFLKFPGGACPRPLLACVCYRSLPLTKSAV